MTKRLQPGFDIYRIYVERRKRKMRIDSYKKKTVNCESRSLRKYIKFSNVKMIKTARS